MGYSADLIQGDPIIITQPANVIEHLLEAQKHENSYKGEGGHISWCASVETYLANSASIYTDLEEAQADALRNLLMDYGFSGVEIKNGALVIEQWGGDKLGSSWDTVWNALSLGYTQDDPTFWIMCGEDMTYWCQMIEEGGSQDLPVAVKYEVVA